MRVPSHGSQTGTRVGVRARSVLLKTQARRDGRIALGGEGSPCTEGTLFYCLGDEALHLWQFGAESRPSEYPCVPGRSPGPGAAGLYCTSSVSSYSCCRDSFSSEQLVMKLCHYLKGSNHEMKCRGLCGSKALRASPAAPAQGPGVGVGRPAGCWGRCAEVGVPDPPAPGVTVLRSLRPACSSLLLPARQQPRLNAAF